MQISARKGVKFYQKEAISLEVEPARPQAELVVPLSVVRGEALMLAVQPGSRVEKYQVLARPEGEGCPVYDGGRQVGVVTSGTHCPWVGQAVALALVDAAYKEPGTPLQVDVRGRRVDAQVVKTPFYRRG